MDGDANSDTNNYLFAADGATRRRPQVINPRLFLPGRPRGEVPVTAGHQFVRAAGAGAISLKPADGTTRLGTIRAAALVLDSQMTPQNRAKAPVGAQGRATVRLGRARVRSWARQSALVRPRLRPWARQSAPGGALGRARARLGRAGCALGCAMARQGRARVRPRTRLGAPWRAKGARHRHGE